MSRVPLITIPRRQPRSRPAARPYLTFPHVKDLKRHVFGTRIAPVPAIRRLFCASSKPCDRYFGEFGRNMVPGTGHRRRKWTRMGCLPLSVIHDRHHETPAVRSRKNTPYTGSVFPPLISGARCGQQIGPGFVSCGEFARKLPGLPKIWRNAPRRMAFIGGPAGGFSGHWGLPIRAENCEQNANVRVVFPGDPHQGLLPTFRDPARCTDYQPGIFRRQMRIDSSNIQSVI